jgi:dTDP-4-amino-4,6-dideoxygalactose transaminase
MNKRSVPFFNYPHVYKSNAAGFLDVFKDVCSRGAFIMQKDLADFEAALAAYCGVKYAIGVANATDALEMGFVAGGLKRGDEVIISSHTMMATASAVHVAGGVPVPVEVGPDRCIDIDSIEAAVTPRTRAICPTQLNGRTCDMDRLLKIAEKHGLDVYEDSAQALGSKFNGRSAGTFGKTGCLSFYPAKVLGCFGDGGAILTNDEDIYRKLVIVRDHGRNADGEVETWARNSRLDNLQAAFLNLQFKDYPKVVARRRAIAALYEERLGGCERIGLPPAPDSDPRHFDIYQNYEIVADKRDELRAFLKERGVGTLIQWGGRAIHQFPKLGFTQHLPKTDEFFKRCIMLPLNMSMTDDDLHYVCDRILDFHRTR